ncbi:MAG: alpha/beta hydrolase [Bacillota bacterium]
MTRVAMMIHGFLTDKNDFGELSEKIADRYDEVFLCEVPGHNAEHDYSAFTVDSTIEYVEKHFYALRSKYDQIDLYGYSMGGALCTYLASKGGVSNVLLFAPANKYLNPSYLVSGFALYYNKIKETLAVSSKETRVKDIESALDVYLQNTKTSMDITIKRLVPYYNKHTLLTFTRLIRQINSKLVPWDARTCIFWGKCDQMVPRSSIEYLSDFYIDTEHYVKIYEDYSHLMLNSKSPERLIADAIKFLDGEDEFSDSNEREYKRKQRQGLRQQYREIGRGEVVPWYKKLAGGMVSKSVAENWDSENQSGTFKKSETESAGALCDGTHKEYDNIVFDETAKTKEENTIKENTIKENITSEDANEKA